MLQDVFEIDNDLIRNGIHSGHFLFFFATDVID